MGEQSERKKPLRNSVDCRYAVMGPIASLIAGVHHDVKPPVHPAHTEHIVQLPVPNPMQKVTVQSGAIPRCVNP